ncbi:hypothetical protein ABK040_006813 [Willaertia magna]
MSSRLSRFNFKAVGKTLKSPTKKLFNQNLILSPSAATTRKENFHTQLFKKNLFSIKNYSSALFSDKKNNDLFKPKETLDPVKYKSWSKEQVCSLLCTDEEKGGANLSPEDVKPLYDSDFGGSSLRTIITDIQKAGEKYAYTELCSINDFKHIGKIPQITLKVVVNWVDNLLKTRLYHLWSVEQVKEQLCIPSEKGGAGLNKEQVNHLFDAGFNLSFLGGDSAIDKIDLPPQDLKKVVNWINSLHCIYVNYRDFNLFTLKQHAFDKLDAFSVKVENFGNSWVYSTPYSNEKFIFSNVKATKSVVDNFSKALEVKRGRPSIEIIGQVHTGKTSSAQYIIPHLLANAINDVRMKNNEPKLIMAPTFYIRFDGHSNPIEMINNALQKLRDVVNVKHNHNATIDTIIDTCVDFTSKYPNTHIFIVLDEVQLIEPYHLTILREFVKNKKYPKVTFILTGSTQSRFLRVLDLAVKNGLSYQEATVTYSVPITNTKDLIEDTFKFHMKTTFTNDQLGLIKQLFGCLNCATISQIIENMFVSNCDFEEATNELIKETFAIFDRDILPYFSKNIFSSHMKYLIIDGVFSTEAIYDKFYLEYMRYFVEIKKLNYAGSTVQYYSFKDKLLQSYLQLRLRENKDGTCELSSLPIDNFSHFIVMQPMIRFGERIKQCAKNTYKNSSTRINTFFTTNHVINNLTQTEIDHMYSFLRAFGTERKLVHNRKQKEKEIFILTSNLGIHTAETCVIKQVKDEILQCWFKGEQESFFSFLQQVRDECTFPLS